jgi:hypothetical protein
MLVSIFKYIGASICVHVHGMKPESASMCQDIATMGMLGRVATTARHRNIRTNTYLELTQLDALVLQCPTTMQCLTMLAVNGTIKQYKSWPPAL